MMNGGPSAAPTEDEDSQQRSSHGHNTHALPPQGVCDVYKKYQAMSDADVDSDPDIIDFARGLSSEQRLAVHVVETLPADTIHAASNELLGLDAREAHQGPPHVAVGACNVYGHVNFPGLQLFPSLVPPEAQAGILNRLLHRDLSQPLHKTNLHDDYHIPYPPPEPAECPQNGSFFGLRPVAGPSLTPRDLGSGRKPLDVNQFLRKRWRWMTMGSQYDWSTRQYPPKHEVPSEFPADIARFVSRLFPPIKAESGVVLVYSPKDYMPVHRDVSELCERELCSFSLGCDGLFIVSLDRDEDLGSEAQRRPLECTGDRPHKPGEDQARPQKTAVVRVRSGDVVVMAGPTRWCWHAMPKVLAGSCPDFLLDWPLEPGMDPKGAKAKAYRPWKGYMTGKRINVSCRTVYD